MKIYLNSADLLGRFVIGAFASLSIILTFMGRDAYAEAHGNSFHFTFSIKDIYISFLSTQENKSVLDNISAGAKVVATYTKTTSKFRLAENIPGVAPVFSPGFDYDSTNDSVTLPLLPEPERVGVIGADIPQALAGGYRLSRISVFISPNVIYHQQGYLDIVKNLAPEKTGDHTKTDLMFEYLAHPNSSTQKNPETTQQDCLFLSTPYGFPDVSIPVAVRVTNDSRFVLTRLTHQYCPVIDQNFTKGSKSNPDHVTKASIAAAQASIDFSTTASVESQWGALPVTKGMSRWYQRNAEGAYASLTQYGSYKEFAIRLRKDTTYPIDSKLPNRTERWWLFNDELVKYSTELYYQGNGHEKPLMLNASALFSENQRVWENGSQGDCKAKECQKLSSELMTQVRTPYEILEKEVQQYMKLPLIPAEDIQN
ncbi:hypothetical protein [Pseudomonas sp. Pseusp97]|uniref:hypothetical protein n=1 Tax=Pseudomonas sp. Pseusp97 TaxID=3243065 RepID=UPI0039A512C5